MVRAADCRSAGPWFKSGCALLQLQNSTAIRKQKKQAVLRSVRPSNGWPALAQGLLGRAAFGSPKACPRLTQGLLKACSRLARKGWLRHAKQKLARAFSQGLSESRPRLLGDVPKACRKLTESLPNACRQLTESLPNACRKLPESLRKAYRKLTESLRNACRTLAESLPKACRKLAESSPNACRRLAQGLPKACSRRVRGFPRRAEGLPARCRRPPDSDVVARRH